MFEDWRTHLSAKYRALLHSIEDDHGKEFSRFLMGVALTQLAKKSLKLSAPEHRHPEIDRAFAMAILPSQHPYYSIKHHALELTVPHLEDADRYIGEPARSIAAFVERKFIEYESDVEASFRRIKW